MLGQIESFRRDIGVGIIKAEDGRKYRFVRGDIINVRSQIMGEEVDFTLNGRTPKGIIVLAGSPWSVVAGLATSAPLEAFGTGADFNLRLAA
jgi:cold shock CspA family protein